MTSRGLGSSFLLTQPRIVTRGSGLQPRLEGLEAAVSAARGVLDEELLDSVEASVARSTGRLRMSAAHTVVAIAGATGSGKSTIFNALAGADLSVSGAQRPTTSTAKALVWSDDDLQEMLEWLGVAAANQHRRASLAPSRPWSRLPEGLLLLDLPDHDSVEVAHHKEAQRIVELADLLIWVVDPQKYADAAIHHRFLQPLSGHRAVTMVVLNHIDTVPEERRKGMLRDLRKLLVADGIRDPRILGTSARHGVGMDELRTAIRRRVEEKLNASLRVEADIRAAAGRLDDASGDAPLSVPDVWISDLERRVADAAGVSALVADRERATRAEALRRMAVPVLRTREAAAPTGEPRLRPLGPVDRPAVDTAVRALVDNVCRDLTPAWGGRIRAAATDRLTETDDRLDAELAALRFDQPLLRWLGMVGLARALATVGILGALLFVGASAIRGASTTVPLIALALAVVMGVGVVLVGKSAAERAGALQARAVEDACGRVIARVVRGQVLAPVRTELASYARFRKGVCAAKA
jgi:GTP-binding protein EngB required for normal cell division